jgi:fido (protein-threonine AMPylation protein)
MDGSNVDVGAIELAARIAASQTFGPFRDEPDSPYYQAEGLSPEATWEHLAGQVAIVCGQAIVQGLNDQRLRTGLMESWHAAIFGELFPDRSGRIRSGREQGQFGVLLGTRENPVPQTYASTPGQNLPRRLDEIWASFEALAGQERVFRLEELAEAAAKLYAKFLNLHPFVDGNGRVSFVLLQFSLARLDLPAVALPDYEEHQWALGLALRRDGKKTYAQLTRLLVDKFDDASKIFTAIQAERRVQGRR